MRLISIISLCGLFFFILTAGAGEKRTILYEGDILFQDFPSPQSTALKLATGSPFTHCGILFFEDSILQVWEAVQPVRKTPFHEWVARDTGEHFVIMRLKKKDSLLTEDILTRMKSYAEKHQGKNYDPYFEWTDSAFYCSEYIWKIFKEAAGIELVSLRKLGDYDFSHPLVKEQLKIRYGDNIPTNEPVIAPGDLFNSNLLDTVLMK